MFTDWYNMPVYVPDYNWAVFSILEGGGEGTYHVVGFEHTSRFEWARVIAEGFDYDPNLITRGDSHDVDLPAARPNNHLRNDEVRDEFGAEFRDLTEGVASVRSDLERR